MFHLLNQKYLRSIQSAVRMDIILTQSLRQLVERFSNNETLSESDRDSLHSILSLNLIPISAIELITKIIKIDDNKEFRSLHSYLKGNKKVVKFQKDDQQTKVCLFLSSIFIMPFNIIIIISFFPYSEYHLQYLSGKPI